MPCEPPLEEATRLGVRDHVAAFALLPALLDPGAHARGVCLPGARLHRDLAVAAKQEKKPHEAVAREPAEATTRKV